MSDGTFEIEDVPVFARGVSAGDRVSVVRHELGLLFWERLSSSGHSTLNVFIPSASIGPCAVLLRLRAALGRLGCASKLSAIPGLVAIDVPPSVPLETVRDFLSSGQEDDLWYVGEACVVA
jgi:hypothetical protein